METELRYHLISCADAFALARNNTRSTVGRLAANDGQFFGRIADGSNFTARKYDEVMAWFDANWPSEALWPSNVPRPTT